MRTLSTDDGVGVIEYSLVVVLIALVAITSVSFVGQTTSGTFDQAGKAFPANPPAATPDDTVVEGGFGELMAALDGLQPPRNSLVRRAEKAQDKYLKGDVDGALRRLDSLINKVNGLEGKKLTTAEADAIRAATRTIVDAIGAG